MTDSPDMPVGRRRWTTAEKVRILDEAFSSDGETVATVIERYGITRGQLYGWRRRLAGPGTGSADTGTAEDAQDAASPEAAAPDRPAPDGAAASCDAASVRRASLVRAITGPPADDRPDPSPKASREPAPPARASGSGGPPRVRQVTAVWIGRLLPTIARGSEPAVATAPAPSAAAAPVPQAAAGHRPFTFVLIALVAAAAAAALFAWTPPRYLAEARVLLIDRGEPAESRWLAAEAEMISSAEMMVAAGIPFGAMTVRRDPVGGILHLTVAHEDPGQAWAALSVALKLHRDRRGALYRDDRPDATTTAVADRLDTISAERAALRRSAGDTSPSDEVERVSAELAEASAEAEAMRRRSTALTEEIGFLRTVLTDLPRMVLVSRETSPGAGARQVESELARLRLQRAEAETTFRPGARYLAQIDAKIRAASRVLAGIDRRDTGAEQRGLNTNVLWVESELLRREAALQGLGTEIAAIDRRRSALGRTLASALGRLEAWERLDTEGADLRAKLDTLEQQGRIPMMRVVQAPAVGGTPDRSAALVPAALLFAAMFVGLAGVIHLVPHPGADAPGAAVATVAPAASDTTPTDPAPAADPGRRRLDLGGPGEATRTETGGRRASIASGARRGRRLRSVRRARR